MAYGYSWDGSIAGSIAPYTWVDKVYSHSQHLWCSHYERCSKTDPIHLYPRTSHTVWFEDAASVGSLFDLCFGVKDVLALSPYPIVAIVWHAKHQLANKYNVKGVAIWRLGGEDTGIYAAARTKFAQTVPTHSTNLGHNSTDCFPHVHLNQNSIEYIVKASDNVGVVKMQYYF